jgi:transposase
MSQTSVITGVGRRRHFTEDQKLELLARAFGPDGNAAETARRADIGTSLLYRWRQAQLAARSGPAFVPAVIADEASSCGRKRSPETAIAVRFAFGATVMIKATAPAALVAATLKALR